MLRAAFHGAIVLHASGMMKAFSLVHSLGAARSLFIHSLGAASRPLRTGAAFLYHHLLLECRLAGEGLIGHPADSEGNKAQEKQATDYDKEPGDTGKQFPCLVFLEFRKQKGARKDR